MTFLNGLTALSSLTVFYTLGNNPSSCYEKIHGYVPVLFFVPRPQDSWPTSVQVRSGYRVKKGNINFLFYGSDYSQAYAELYNPYYLYKVLSSFCLASRT